MIVKTTKLNTNRRIHIPVPILRSLNLEVGDKLILVAQDGKLLVKIDK